jgi:16S rRNA processing protein RimM
MTEKRVCLAQFAGAHGVRGEAKVKCFTAEEASVAAYGPLTTEDGARRFSLKFLRAPKPGLAIVRAPEIASREDAIALSGVKLYAARSALPPVESEDEFYIEDIIGLDAFADSGRALGRIVAVHNFGAGDVIELRGASALFVPFTLSAVPHIDIRARTVTVAETALTEIDATRPDADSDGELDAMRAEDA